MKKLQTNHKLNQTSKQQEMNLLNLDIFVSWILFNFLSISSTEQINPDGEFKKNLGGVIGGDHNTLGSYSNMNSDVSTNLLSSPSDKDFDTIWTPNDEFWLLSM